LTGIMLAVAPFNWQLTDSYFVVAHFHYTLEFIPIMVYWASPERRHHVWPVYDASMCRPVPRSSWI